MEVTYKKPCENSLLLAMKEMLDEELFTDCKLEVEGNIFSVHKPVLYCNSPMLKKLLTSETRDKYKEVIKLEGLDVEYFKLVLKYMYTEVIDITPDNTI